MGTSTPECGNSDLGKVRAGAKHRRKILPEPQSEILTESKSAGFIPR